MCILPNVKVRYILRQQKEKMDICVTVVSNCTTILACLSMMIGDIVGTVTMRKFSRKLIPELSSKNCWIKTEQPAGVAKNDHEQGTWYNGWMTSLRNWALIKHGKTLNGGKRGSGMKVVEMENLVIYREGEKFFQQESLPKL